MSSETDMVNEMKVVWARVLVLSILVMGAMVLSAIAVSTNASAAAVDGTWDSRVSGEGYTRTYPDPDGNIVTDSSDAKLVVSSSGGAVAGTLTIVSGSYDVTGTFDGTTFVMRLFWGWDGVTYCEGVYTLTVDGDRMYGSGSYLNVGYTINGYFDLEKGGVFAVGGITPVVSGVTISLAIFSIIIAVMPAAGAPAAGFRPPQPTHVPSPPSRYEPSQQWTTDVPDQPMSGDGTVSMGGAGLQYATPPPAGRPFSPRDHFTNVSQEPPRCPFHNGVALTPHYFRTDGTDPGSWFCPMCKGYPWGKN